MGLLSSKSSSKVEYITNTTDNRAVSGDNSIIVGQGGSFSGTDPGLVKLAEFNTTLLREVSANQTDGAKALFNAGAQVLDNLGGSVTDIYKTSGANATKALEYSLDVTERTIDRLTAGAKANSDASQVVAMAALSANKSDGSALSDAFKYTAIAIAAVALIYAFKGN